MAGGFARVERAGVQWLLAPGTDADALGPLLDGIPAAVAAGEGALKQGRRKALHALPGASGGEVLVKVNRYAGLRRWLRAHRSKARRELERAHALAARGVATPLPLAAGERRRGGRVDDCFLVVPRLPRARDLAACWRAPDLSPTRRRALAAGLGALAARLHDAGLFQDDFAPNNFLVDEGPDGRPTLLAIDFERARLRRRPASLRERRWMLAKLERRMGSAARGSDRLRFLRAYDPTAARDWWERIAAFAPELARRDLRRWHRTARSEGRRFRSVASGGWHGWARREADPAEILAAADHATTGPGAVGRSDGHWTLCCAPGDAPAWERANLLWDGRGLVPRPLAWLVRGSAGVLVLEGVGERAGDADGAAVRVLARRLAGYGRLAGPLRPEDAARTPGGALLLDPRRWEPL